jgi:hypothetical protein
VSSLLAGQDNAAGETAVPAENAGTTAEEEMPTA